MNTKLQQAVALKSKIFAYQQQLTDYNVGRDVIGKASMLTYISSRPTFLLGPFGLGKTEGLQFAASLIGGASFYDILIPNVTAAEQILVSDTLVRIQETSDGQLIRMEDVIGEATLAHVVFADELYKPRDASVLQGMLDIANGKSIRYRGKEYRTENLAFFGASNEIPTDPKMGASWARMIFRVPMYALDRKGKMELTRSRLSRYQAVSGGRVNLQPILTLDDVLLLREVRPFVQYPQDVEETVLDILEGLFNGTDGAKWKWAWDDDRRYGRITDAVQAAALMAGRTIVTKSDLWVLNWMYWNEESQIPIIQAAVAPYIRTPVMEAKEEINTLMAPDGAVQKTLNGDRRSGTAAISNADTVIANIIAFARKDPAYTAEVIGLLREVIEAMGQVMATMTGVANVAGQIRLAREEVEKVLTAEERGYLHASQAS